MLRKHRPILLSILVCGACYKPVLNLRAIGCFDVHAPDWTSSKAREYSFTFPAKIELDSAFAADHPTARRGWPWNDDGGVHWSNTAYDWLLLPGDTIIGIPGQAAFHTLSADSIRVMFWSRAERFDAWFAPTATGYQGLAQRVDWKTGRRETVPVTLQRAPCSTRRAT